MKYFKEIENPEERIQKTQDYLNNRLKDLFNRLGIKNFRLISMGNSIASGYSMLRTTKPLLLRNDSLKSILAHGGVNVDTHHFARAQNNNDKRVHSWLTKNIKESEMHAMNRTDYAVTEDGKVSPTGMIANGLTSADMDRYYPTEMKDDKGLGDLVYDSDKDLANIVVYNGATGSFLDGLTRNGSIGQQLNHGVKRDISGIESTLDDILANNRENNCNTQVYLCGVPNLLGIHVSGLINYRLRKLAKKYPNVTYVEPVKAKMLNAQLDREGNETTKKGIDIHYNENEYREFNNNIVEAIVDNYEINKALINIDRKCYLGSEGIEHIHPEYHQKEKSDARRKMTEYMITRELESDTQMATTTKLEVLKRFKKYMKEVFPYDYFYMDKKDMGQAIKNISNSAKSELKEENKRRKTA